LIGMTETSFAGRIKLSSRLFGGNFRGRDLT